MRTRIRSAFAVFALSLAAGAAPRQQSVAPQPSLEAVRQYIAKSWDVLTRSLQDLPRAAPDPKMHRVSRQPWPVYVPADEDRGAIERRLGAVLSADDLGQLEIRTLPERLDDVSEPGLLYLPRPYVVPGGRFNEMYGWDSYFIQLGLLREDRVELARDMTDNLLYEIAHYGTILNANRTYFLTRSQPPFLTEMILGVYDKTHDRDWLRGTMPGIEKYYAFWTSAPHLVEPVGLSRYFDRGEGPAPEVLADERDAAGRTHYDRVREYYRTHRVDDYDVSQFYDAASDRLTDLFYKGDRSMRESGFDPSNRFGPFSVDIIHYTPVCLNVLLFRMEEEAGRIAAILGDRKAADTWRTRARRRRQLMDRYLWDADAGLYFDYNFQTGRRRHYEFATTFYPLWAGSASPQQARAVLRNLPRFEAPGGLLTSTQVTGSQWDAPFGWAPLQIIAVEGLRRYGFQQEADRLARKFVSLVAEDFDAHGTIVEKYDVRRRSSDLAQGLRFGYTSNEIGFGWTNSAVLELTAGLNRRTRVKASGALAGPKDPPYVPGKEPRPTALAAARQVTSLPATAVERFEMRSGGLELQRPTRAGAFFDVVGRRSAIFGYENREWEAWVYPLKVVDGFRLSFRLEGYPLDIDGRSIMTHISVRPEATTLTYAHAAFTVRQIMIAPLDEPGILVLLDVNSVLPMTITASFQPRLRLMWPAASMTANIGWNASANVYMLTEETRRYAAVIGCPYGQDASVMPYQEEPRDVPNQLVIEAPLHVVDTQFIPIVIAGSVHGLDAARSTYDKVLASARSLYEQTAEHYERLDRDTLRIDSPAPRLDEAFRWAKIGIDKGIATNPLLGIGLVAGFRTSGDSERPGFAWFFGRDALWTALAIDAYGDFAATRTALEFLRKFQRDDGKIPHEISQSASLVPWFDGYPYAWASADATPLYVIAHADYWRATGDRDFIKTEWPSILKAYRFAAASDTDGNALIENTKVGHGWVEGGALYPPHEEVYLQGLWVAASRGMAELADAINDPEVAASARAAAERTRSALERTYWLADRGFYAFATAIPHATPSVAEPGPTREARQARLDQLAGSRLIDEDTVLPAVPLWFEVLDARRGQSEIDHLGAAALATDWGDRILSNHSALYDPLSYHYGSVWPLFTGWAAVAAYRYGRPHVGQQALMANASLTWHGALGYVTELLSGDFATPFGRSSHHQVWSQAMVVAPLVRGLLGIEASDGGQTLVVRPQLPANWNALSVDTIPVGSTRYDLRIERSANRETILLTERNPGGHGIRKLIVAPAFPADARVRRVTVNGRSARFQLTGVGDMQRAAVVLESPSSPINIVFGYDEGTDVYVDPEAPLQGATSEGLRVIRARAGDGRLHLVVEGRGGRAYVLHVRTPWRLGRLEGTVVRAGADGGQELAITFDGRPDQYVRRELDVPLVGSR